MLEDKPDEAIQATKADVRMLSDQMDALGDLVWVAADLVMASIFTVAAVFMLVTPLPQMAAVFGIYAGLFTLLAYARGDVRFARGFWNGTIGRVWDTAHIDDDDPKERMNAANDYFTGENE